MFFPLLLFLLIFLPYEFFIPSGIATQPQRSSNIKYVYKLCCLSPDPVYSVWLHCFLIITLSDKVIFIFFLFSPHTVSSIYFKTHFKLFIFP